MSKVCGNARDAYELARAIVIDYQTVRNGVDELKKKADETKIGINDEGAEEIDEIVRAVSKCLDMAEPVLPRVAESLLEYGDFLRDAGK